ncbi:ABC transporter substrate-binding protein [Streptomyces collinus]|uniref:ABC transporter substrate-binding protein n=1 Tax=Streptomyces collinus TaxID=42684 RepID=UPI003817C6AF
MLSSKRAQRSVFAAVGAVALFVGAVGCSGDSSGSSKNGNLSLMIWDPAQKAGVQKAVDGFEAANPGIHVTLEQVPEDQYYTKLDASLSSGGGPDVMWQSSKAPAYVDGGALQPLDEYIKRDKVSLAAYPATLVNLYKIHGKQYGMPKDQDVWTVVYNASVFKKLGVKDVPTPDWTWDDMVKIAKEIKAKQTSSADVPMYYNYFFNSGVASIIRQLGGTVVKDGKGTVSSPDGIKAFEMVKDLQDQKLIPKVADSADYNAVTSLISGHLAMAKIPSYQLSLLSQADVPSGTFHVVPQPSINRSNAQDTNGLSYVMNAHSSHKDEAWKLIKYLTSDKGASLHVEGGASPAANVSPSVQAAYYKTNGKLVGLHDAFATTLRQNYLRTTTQYPALRAVLDQIEGTVTGPYYAGSLSAPQAAKKIDDIMNGALR